MHNEQGNGGNRQGGYGQVDRREKHVTNRWLYALQIGFFGGLIWGGLRWLFYEMKFTKVLPGFLGEPFLLTSFLRSPWGLATGIGLYILFSIAAAFLYIALFSKLRGPWPGMLYGLFWWGVLFLAFGPMLGMMGPITAIGWDSFYSELCVSLLWGLFIGYSIAFEFTDEASREPVRA
ncbi:YqhR family membrane protein [Paenibacillus sp. J5C_2022]|uniref:YqhR family membrane protein n=1 Tax=Paenibacillus sp. J5C2022 TaxID=2977129 RepID=UPI0021CEFC33|nr:YqhR family membrane protein [Paenibacillus sp. J5C2022]MCU6710160.1 YqhR family membrane protein [Paenibacillus sp. J5C2022]